MFYFPLLEFELLLWYELLSEFAFVRFGFGVGYCVELGAHVGF